MHKRALLSTVAVGLLPLLLLLQSSCTRAPDSSGTPGEVLKPDRMSEEHQRLAERARQAKEAMFQTLLGRLTSALDQGGPTFAIDVCKRVAPQIAQEISAEMRLRVGRTSHRLRNPKNAPPKWAERLVEDRVKEATYVALPGGGIGALLPIVTAAACLKCHGDADQIPPDVREAIAESYPTDGATGFSTGDLRGWFWVEVPPEAATQ